MLTALAKHSHWRLKLVTHRSDCNEVDDHHTVEDVALVLGTALREAVGIGSQTADVAEKMRGVARFGYAYAPLDETLARCVVDLSNRPHCTVNLQLKREMLGKLSCEMIPHFFQSLSMAAGITLHIDIIRGDNDHHK